MEAAGKKLSANALKAAALVCMTVSHLAYAFIGTDSVTGQVLQCTSRIAMPLFAFFITQGYIHTSSVKRYTLRLLACGVISQVPYSLFKYGTVLYMGELNICFTLLTGLLLIMLWDRGMPFAGFAAALVIGFAAAQFCDWRHYAVLLCLVFYIFRDNEGRRCAALAAVTLLMTAEQACGGISAGMSAAAAVAGSLPNLAVALNIPLLHNYSGRLGRPLPGGKRFFYIYYPLHMLVIWLMSAVL